MTARDPMSHRIDWSGRASRTAADPMQHWLTEAEVRRIVDEQICALLRRFGAAPRSGTAYHVEPVAGAVSVVIEDGLQLERIVQAGETVLMIRRAR